MELPIYIEQTCSRIPLINVTEKAPMLQEVNTTVSPGYLSKDFVVCAVSWES
jgi:hypothetical protein